MDLRRTAGLAGIISGILFVISLILTFSAGQPPALDEPASKVTQYYEDNKSMLQLNGIIGFITLFLVPIWFVPIYRWIRDRAWARGGAGTTTTTDDDAGAWITLAFGGFIAAGALVGAQTGVATALTMGIEDELGGNDATVTALFDLYNGLGAAFGVVFALYALGLALGARATEYFPSWASPVLLVVTLTSLLSIFGPFTESDFFAILALIAFVLFIVVIIGSSLRLLGGARPSTGTTGTPTTGTTT